MHRPSCQSHRNFNSRPHGGRLDGTSERGLNRRFQLTPSRRATRCTVHLVNLIEISTHALTEGDQFTTALRLSFFISTHALTEGDILPACILIQNCIFQLTPSRRATDFYFTHGILLSFQLTPSRRATGHLCHGLQRHGISTHALTEGDNTALSGCTEEERFQLTPSRRATFSRMCLNQPIHISTHALTEGDCSRSGHLIFPEIFQLTPSRRATVTGRCLRLSASYFNSRPHGGRRDSDRIKDVFAYISTHALTEGDHILIRYSTRYPHFNSRPHGGRPELYALFFQIFRISTHALTEGDAPV